MTNAMRTYGNMIMLAGAALWGCQNSSAGSNVPLFDTTSWGRPGGLLMRTAAPESETLLLRHRTSAERFVVPQAESGDHGASETARAGEIIYRYRPDGNVFEQADPDAWTQATGAIQDCAVPQDPPADQLSIDSQTKTLRRGDLVIATAGKLVLSAVAAPGGQLVAVLSADGPVRGGTLPALTEGGATGPHYHQFFKLPDATPVSEAVRLPITSEKSGLTACWSADSRYVVYTDVLFNHLCIVQQSVPGDQ